MKVSFTELKRHVIELKKRNEELDIARDDYVVAEREFEQHVAKLRAEFRESIHKKHNFDRLCNRRDIWHKKRDKVRAALERKYPGLTIATYSDTPDVVRVSYLGKRETMPWEDVDDWMVITLLQSDHGRE